MDLTLKLADMAARWEAEAPDDVREMMLDMVAGIKRAGVGETAPAVGERVPDVNLSRADGTPLRLYDLAAEQPLVLSFFRGGWCPFCSTELDALEAMAAEAAELGGRVVGVSPLAPASVTALAAERDTPITLLSDPDSRAIEAFGLVFAMPERVRELYRSMGVDIGALNGDARWHLPVPATFVLDRDAIVRAAFVEADFRERFDPSLLLHALRWYVPGGEGGV